MKLFCFDFFFESNLNIHLLTTEEQAGEYPNKINVFLNSFDEMFTFI